MPNYHQLELDGIPIEILQKRIKNIHLRVYPPDARVVITAPLWLSLKQIKIQLEGKKQWISAQREKILQQPFTSIPTFISGESHYFLGRPYTLSVIESSDACGISLIDECMILSLQRSATLEEKASLVKKWYQSQMANLIPHLIEKWQRVIGVEVASWGIKCMKTRWGSCNTRTRRIYLNLELIKKPRQSLEYVLVHEMIHLLEASHNHRFYELMDRFMHDWRSHQKALYHTQALG
jgi:predicted metal-dependent hydrolase